jgi:hypothetical protein
MRNLVAIPFLMVVVILQSAVMSHIRLLSGYGDLPLVLLAAWAIQPNVDSGWQWATLTSLLIGFMSRVPWPAVLLGYLSVILVAQILRRRVWQAPLLAMFATTLLATVAFHLFTYVALALSGSFLAVSEVLSAVTLPSLLINLLLAIPAYALMRDLSRWVYPEQEMV